jgi:hypothetical protein
MRNLFFKNYNRLIVREWLKFDHIFISPYELQFFFVFQFLCPKSIFFESFRWGNILLDFVGFPFRTSKLKLTSTTLNVSFHIDLGRFVGDWTCIIQRLGYIVTFFKAITMFIWIILNNLVWTCNKGNFCWYWTIVTCIYLSAFVTAFGEIFLYNIFGLF